MTDEPKLVRLDEIVVPHDRLRPVDEAAATRLAELIGEQGQLSPVILYRSNAGSRPYTLICGARRLRAMELLGKAEVAAILRPKSEATILQITDNLNASGLTQLEKAEYLVAYRKEWESRNGNIERGGNRKSKVQNAPLILSNYFNELELNFGLRKDVAKRLYRIGTNLRPSLKDVLRGTPLEDDQGRLLTFAKMNPDQQWDAQLAFTVAGGDIKRTMKLLKPQAGRLPKKEWLRQRLVSVVADMSHGQLVKVMSELGYDVVRQTKQAARHATAEARPTTAKTRSLLHLN